MRWLILLPALLVLSYTYGLIDHEHHRPEINRVQLMYNDKNLNAIAKYLREYRQEQGHYPSNEEGLMAVPHLVKLCVHQLYAKDYDYDLTYCRLINDEIVGIKGDPFIYENRTGLNPRNFTDSGATLDKERHYSICVDKDIYVWSVGAQQSYQNHLKAEASYRIKLALGFTGSLLLLLAYIIVTFRTAKSDADKEIRGFKILGVFVLDALIIVMGWLFINRQPRESCYMPGYSERRTIQLTQDYLCTMQKYRDRGVISDAAYQKIVSSMEKAE